jgi:hypothetical protein
VNSAERKLGEIRRRCACGCHDKFTGGCHDKFTGGPVTKIFITTDVISVREAERKRSHHFTPTVWWMLLDGCSSNWVCGCVLITQGPATGFCEQGNDWPCVFHEGRGICWATVTSEVGLCLATTCYDGAGPFVSCDSVLVLLTFDRRFWRQISPSREPCLHDTEERGHALPDRDSNPQTHC